MKLFVTGIGTNCGKTVCSAILTEALKADYWKPVQTGENDRDLVSVKALVSNTDSIFHEEAYLLKKPVSPNIAAEVEGKTVDLNTIEIPPSDNEFMIIEGAGGILVPINDENTILDIALKCADEVVIVTQEYLGCNNHTLLTYNLAKQKGLKIHSVILNGYEDDYIIKTLRTYMPDVKFLTVPHMNDVRSAQVKKIADQILK